MMLRKTLFLFCFLLVCLPYSGKAQHALPDSSLLDKKKLLILGSTFSVGYSAMIMSLNKAWYAKEERSNFHFFNDNKEWKQVDKAGHFWGAFHESRHGIQLLRWAGLPEKKAILYGGMVGTILQTPIEIFDGYQTSYGASVGDLVANTAGSAAVVAQELAWGETRIIPKYSFHKTHYAGIRPNVLGSNLSEQILKDYNGQTHWLSVNLGSFLPEASNYPKWLNIAIGYGAEEMVYNSTTVNRALGLDAHRQFYISPDLNLSYFKGHNKVLNTALFILEFIKIPAPALEYNRKEGFKAYPIYF